MFLWSILVVIFKEPTSLSSFSWSSSNSSSTLKHSTIPPTTREQWVLVSFGQFFTIIMSLSKFYAPNLHCHKPINMLAMFKKIDFNLRTWNSQKLMHKKCKMRKLICMVFPPWFHIIIAHSYMTIQWQFYSHQKKTNFMCKRRVVLTKNHHCWVLKEEGFLHI